MIQALYDKIQEYLKNETNSINTFEGFDSIVRINNGASRQEIENIQAQLKVGLPSEYIRLLMLFDGGVFFQVDDLGGFNFHNSKELIEQNLFQSAQYEDAWDSRVIVICSCIGDGDYIGLRVFDDGSYEVVDCFIEEPPNEWKSICNSVEDFLYQLILERGRKFWL